MAVFVGRVTRQVFVGRGAVFVGRVTGRLFDLFPIVIQNSTNQPNPAPEGVISRGRGDKGY